MEISYEELQVLMRNCEREISNEATLVAFCFESTRSDNEDRMARIEKAIKRWRELRIKLEKPE